MDGRKTPWNPTPLPLPSTTTSSRPTDGELTQAEWDDFFDFGLFYDQEKDDRPDSTDASDDGHTGHASSHASSLAAPMTSMTSSPSSPPDTPVSMTTSLPNHTGAKRTRDRIGEKPRLASTTNRDPRRSCPLQVSHASPSSPSSSLSSTTTSERMSSLPPSPQGAETKLEHRPAPVATPPIKKVRVLQHPEKTQEVRRKRACLRCRIGRLECDTADVCGKCVKSSEKLESRHAADICIHQNPSQILGPRSFRWSFHERDFTPDVEGRSDGYISLSKNCHAPCLMVPIGRLRSSINDVVYGIPAHEGPSDESMHGWIERQMDFEGATDFFSTVSSLLRAYVEAQPLPAVAARCESLGPKVQSTVKAVMAMLAGLRTLTLAMRLWAADQLYIHRASPRLYAYAGPQAQDIRPVAGQCQLIAYRLRHMAEETMAEAEREVLSHLEFYVAYEAHIKKETHPLLWQAVNVAVWIATTQLMLLYRKALKVHAALSKQHYVDAANSKRWAFGDATKKLLDAVCVIHSELFRTRNVLNSLMDAGVDVLGRESLHAAFRLAWARHFEFYQQVRDGVGVDDDVFRAQVVIKEEKVLGRKPQNKSVKKGQEKV